MTIRRRPRPLWRRGVLAALLCAAVLYLAAITAAHASPRSALEELERQGGLAVALLRTQLAGAGDESALPAMVTLALGQSPALYGSREAVLSLQSEEESDLDGGEEPPAEDAENGGASHGGPPAILSEEAAEPETPLIFADNGVPARTLLPSSADGYVVAGDVYVNNRADVTFDASLFDGSFAASLSEGDGPQVLILHTHGSEAYTMPAGEEYEPSGECRTTDCDCNVVRVGEELREALEAEGISVLHDETLHDYPEYSGAYGRSLTTAEAYLAEYPGISVILDVHRDAVTDADGAAYKVVSAVGGVNAAQMSFVVGTDAGGLEHPLWRENLKLAAAVQQTVCEDFPTLMRPITVRNSRYNQHLTPGCLLVEVGAAGNSLDEALFSARILGKALAETLTEK